MKIQDVICSVSLGLILTQGFIQCVPTHTLSKPSILSSMIKDLTSPFGSCSFPPEDVLKNVGVDSYEFLEPCHRKIPPVNVSLSDGSLIMCMGLLEVGLRLCALDKTHFDGTGHSLLDLPNSSQMFNNLLDDLNKLDHTNLCSDLQKEDVLGTNQYPLINGWNLIKVFQETDDICTRICFDLKNRPNIICQLILWGSNQLKQSVTGLADNSHGYPNVSDLDQLQNNSNMLRLNILGRPSGGSTGIESKPLDPEVQSQDVHSSTPSATTSDNGLNNEEEKKDPPNESVNQIGTLSQPISKSDHTLSQIGANKGQVNPSKNFQKLVELRPSKALDISSNSQLILNPSDPNFQAGNALEDKHSEQTKPGSEASDGTDDLINNDEPLPFKAITTIKPTSSEQIPKQLVSEEKNILPPSHHQQDASSGKDQLTLKTGSVFPVSRQPIDPIDAVHDNPPAKSTVNSVGRMSDFGQSEDDTSLGLDQNPDANDDINFPDIDQQQSDMSRMPTESPGFNTNNYKYQREQLPHENIYNHERFEDQEDSHFFSYFMTMIVLCIVGYVVFHNKQKIMALALEGRSRRSSRRRPTTANYHKLDNNLEEAVSSPCSTSVTHVIY